MLKRLIPLLLILCLLLTPAQAEDQATEILLFYGSASATGLNANVKYIFTAHVGGDWEASQMNPGCAIEVTYTGPENAIYLALSSHSGARQWAQVNADSFTHQEDGSWVATFTCQTIQNSWGSNFARLDQVSVISKVTETVTVKLITYLPGEGEPIDQSDGRWDRPDHGTAFIGDSICQNPGDWNPLLGRTDCVNFGIGAQTTTHCLKRIGELCGRGYSQVVFICGINELGRSDYETGIVANFDAMVQILRADKPDIRAVIVSVLPTTEAFYYGMQGRIVRLNTILREYAEQTENVTFVNCYDDFIDLERGYAKPELLTDGLHPNADGYALMARRIAEALMPEEGH